jgi:hypothetical protein
VVAATGGPTFFCRRWDQVGGRLAALTNTVALARSFGWDFRFIWPKGRDAVIGDPVPLLSPSFRRQFEITQEDLQGHAVVPEGEILDRDRTGVRDYLTDMDEQVFVEINDPFAILRPRNDDEAVAARRFIDAFHSIGWSDEARRLIEFASSWNADEVISTLHVRGGDIVSGPWRHNMYYGKYMPLPFVTYAVHELSRRAGQLLVMSDNASLLEWLRRDSDSVLTAAAIVPGYDRLPPMLQAFMDILLMSRCDAVYGPSDSAFSGLAAHVGGRRVMPVDRLVPLEEQRTVLHSGIRRNETVVAESPFLRPFVARDIVWYVDVYGDGLPLHEQLQLTRRAVALDDDAICVTARLAHVAALTGDLEEAATATAALMRMRQVLEGDPDALVESVATQVAAEAVELVLGAGRYGLDALRHGSTPEERRATLTSALEGFGASIELVLDTESSEIDNAAVADNLRDLVSVVEWLAQADDVVLDALESRRHTWNGTDVDMERFREATLSAELDDTTTVFPGVLRNFDRAVIHLSQAIGTLMTPVGEARTASMRGSISDVVTGKAGVQWLRGWVTENSEREGRLLGGLALVTSADFTGGAATTFTLPDFDEIVGPTFGETVGFRMPVPRDMPSPMEHADVVRVLGVARDGRTSELRPD